MPKVINQRTDINRVLGVVAQLAKAPIPGQVKTRMQPELDIYQSVSLHKAMTEHIADTLSIREEWAYELWVNEEHDFFSRFATRSNVTLRQQVEGNLGVKLNAISEHYFSFHSGFKTELKTGGLVLIGSDCPSLTPSHIAQLFDSLLAHDVSIIPAQDGGYVAIALRDHFPYVFQQIDWGTERVLTQTLERIDKLRLRKQLFPELSDVDRPEDLELLRSLNIHF